MSIQRQINNLRHSWRKLSAFAKLDRILLLNTINSAKAALNSIENKQDLIIDKVLELEIRLSGLESGTVIRLGSALTVGRARGRGIGTVV